MLSNASLQGVDWLVIYLEEEIKKRDHKIRELELMVEFWRKRVTPVDSGDDVCYKERPGTSGE